MSGRSFEWSRARWVRTLAAGVAVGGAAVGLLGAGWGAGDAWASGHAAGAKAEGKALHAAPKLPVIGHATDLAREPVVHATKGKPPTKLEVKNLVRGTGAVAKRSSTVDVMYVGANYKTGKDFTQGTWTEGRPTAFSLVDVVPGFAEGLVGMRVGGRREIVIPPKLGYKNLSTGAIEPGETLVFVVDLKGVSG